MLNGLIIIVIISYIYGFNLTNYINAYDDDQTYKRFSVIKVQEHMESKYKNRNNYDTSDVLMDNFAVRSSPVLFLLGFAPFLHLHDTFLHFSISPIA